MPARRGGRMVPRWHDAGGRRGCRPVSLGRPRRVRSRPSRCRRRPRHRRVEPGRAARATRCSRGWCRAPSPTPSAWRPTPARPACWPSTRAAPPAGGPIGRVPHRQRDRGPAARARSRAEDRVVGLPGRARELTAFGGRDGESSFDFASCARNTAAWSGRPSVVQGHEIARRLPPERPVIPVRRGRRVL